MSKYTKNGRLLLHHWNYLQKMRDFCIKEQENTGTVPLVSQYIPNEKSLRRGLSSSPFEGLCAVSPPSFVAIKTRGQFLVWTLGSFASDGEFYMNVISILY